MTSRKNRRNIISQENEKLSSGARAKLLVMFISVALMVFSLVQVYYLLMYTMGKHVPEEKMKVYRWVQLIVNGDDTITEQSSL